MDQRLKIILELIDKNSKGICDVGTDHGFVPVKLAADGYNGNIIAADINPEPLRRAESNANSLNVSERIVFCLHNGLPEHFSDKFDTAVIAGMGGDLICSIIDRADWIFSDKYTLILQPMTKPEIVRYYLANNGFNITEDWLASDRGRLYQVIKCKFTSVNDKYTDLELFSGKISICNDKAMYFRLLTNLRENMEMILNKTTAAGKRQAEVFYGNILNEIYEITGINLSECEYGIKD